MDENAAPSTHVENVTSSEEVSGWSIFWALIAIGSYAMLQVSFTGFLFNGDTFSGSLWPHRSSPLICAIDGVADAYLSFQAFRRRDPVEGGEKPKPDRNGTLSKIALFSLGVVPQAIKLFSMRGIPLTQGIAGLYLVPSMLGLLRSLTSPSPERDIQRLHGRLATHDVLKPYFVKLMTFTFGWFPHCLGIFMLWHRLVDRIGFSAPQNVINAAGWMGMILTFVGFFSVLPHVACAFFYKRAPIRFYPLLFFVAFTNTCSIPDLVAEPGSRLERGKQTQWTVTMQMMFSLCLACYAFANLSYYLADWCFNRCNGCGRRHWLRGVCHDDAIDHTSSSVGEDTVGSDESTMVNGTEANGTQTRTADLGQEHRSEPPDQETIPRAVSLPSERLPAVHPRPEIGNTLDSGYSTDTPMTSSRSQTAQGDEYQAPKSTWREQPWEKLLELFMIMIVLPLVLCFSLLHLALPEDDSDREDADANAKEQQTAAEEGVAQTSAVNRNRDDRAQDTTSTSGFVVLNKLSSLKRLDIRKVLKTVLRLIITAIRTLIARLGLGLAVPYFLLFEWIKLQVTEKHPVSILVNAFGLLNLSTAVVCYLVYFEGEGTSAPTWSEILG